MTRVATRTHTVHIYAHAQCLSPLQSDRTVWTEWQLAPPCSACASVYVSKPVLVQGLFLLHRSVFSSIPGYTELLCKYTVLVAILVLHRGVQARVSALFFVSPMKCKLVIVGFLVIYGFIQ